MNDPELRAAFARLDRALQDARAALGPEPEPEQEPPSVEVIDAGSGATWLFSRIDKFELRDGRWRVWGHPRSPDGYGWDGCYIATAATPFAIWQECVRKGVPCCDPPSVTLTLNIGDKWRVFAVNELCVAESGNTFIRCIGNRAEYPAKHAVENIYYVTESPAAIRAACAREGVPCVGEPEPRGVVVQCGGRDTRLATIDEIGAGVCPGAGPRLYVKLGSCLSWTTTPLADIIAQAKAAGMRLPKATVKAGRDWTAITKVTVAAGTDVLVYSIHGEADGGPVEMLFAPYTPAEVCQLCKLAGWPRPEVRCEFTYTNGDLCEVAPDNISGVGVARHATTIETNTPLADGSYIHHVREPGKQVRAMIDACKEVSDDGNM